MRRKLCSTFIRSENLLVVGRGLFRPMLPLSQLLRQTPRTSYMCLRSEISFVPREIKGSSETFIMSILPEKRLILLENITPAFHYWRENVATYWENRDSLFSLQLFLLTERRYSRQFFKLGAWREAKTRACLLRYSTLKSKLGTGLAPGCRVNLPLLHSPLDQHSLPGTWN